MEWKIGILPTTLIDLWYKRCGTFECGCYVVHGTTSNVDFLFGSLGWVLILNTIPSVQLEVNPSIQLKKSVFDRV